MAMMAVKGLGKGSSSYTTSVVTKSYTIIEAIDKICSGELDVMEVYNQLLDPIKTEIDNLAKKQFLNLFAKKDFSSLSSHHQVAVFRQLRSRIRDAERKEPESVPLLTALEQARDGSIDPVELFPVLPTAVQNVLDQMSKGAGGQKFCAATRGGQRTALAQLLGLLAEQASKGTRATTSPSSSTAKVAAVAAPQAEGVSSPPLGGGVAAEKRIRDRAHRIWEAEGRPEGKEKEHWSRAVAEELAAEATQPKPRDPGYVTSQHTAGPGDMIKPAGTPGRDQTGEGTRVRSPDADTARPAEQRGDAVAQARALLARDRPAEAASLLAGAPPSRDLANARAVCALRVGKPRQAIDVLRPEILPNGARLPPETTPDAWIITYATALALAGDPGGAGRALRWVVKNRHGRSATQLRDALDAWRKSLSWKEAARYRLSGDPSRPVRLAFPPGEL